MALTTNEETVVRAYFQGAAVVAQKLGVSVATFAGIMGQTDALQQVIASIDVRDVDLQAQMAATNDQAVIASIQAQRGTLADRRAQMVELLTATAKGANW